MRMGWMVAVAALGAFGCGHSESTTARAGYEQQAKNDFEDAYDAVKRGFESSATAGKYALRSAGQGVVEVTDATKAGARGAAGGAKDAWIKSKIESKFAMNKEVKASNLDVSSDNGVVRLSGTVDNPREAERAVELALDTDGVQAVKSNLHYRRPPKSR
jgi:osmotically-inducible protein OsmY